jgi:hypothetical protein
MVCLVKPKIVSWNVRDKWYRIRDLIRECKADNVYKRLNWSLFLRMWCLVYGVVNIWIGHTWGREGLLGGYF